MQKKDLYIVDNMKQSKGDNSHLEINIADLISLHEASEICNLSQGHLALLIRNEELKGWKIGRNWVTTREAITDYLFQIRKPGPKKNKPT